MFYENVWSVILYMSYNIFSIIKFGSNSYLDLKYESFFCLIFEIIVRKKLHSTINHCIFLWTAPLLDAFVNSSA